MSMSRKDYQLIAMALAATRPTKHPEAALHAAITLALAKALSKENPNFNSTLFLSAASEPRK